MSLQAGLKHWLRRDRRPGDLAFAAAFLLLAIFLLTQLGDETRWVKRTRFFAQPAFWPTISLAGMVLFAALHWLGMLLSPRKPGRRGEIFFWLRSLEYAAWFLLYVGSVPIVGYLGATLVFCLFLTFRLGYRDRRSFAAAAGVAVGVVLVFKSFLQVKIPAGQVYEYLPDVIRNIMLIYF